nr:PREDICTED: uncharacterized protein LOC109626067 [Paralichthys olivaceus]
MPLPAGFLLFARGAAGTNTDSCKDLNIGRNGQRQIYHQTLKPQDFKNFPLGDESKSQCYEWWRVPEAGSRVAEGSRSHGGQAGRRYSEVRTRRRPESAEENREQLLWGSYVSRIAGFIPPEYRRGGEEERTRRRCSKRPVVCLPSFPVLSQGLRGLLSLTILSAPGHTSPLKTSMKKHRRGSRHTRPHMCTEGKRGTQRSWRGKTDVRLGIEGGGIVQILVL